MVEEEKPKTQNQEKALSILEQVKAEKEGLDKTLTEIREEREKLAELKAQELLSGKTPAGQQIKEKPKEISPEEYAKNALQGKV